MCASSWSIVPNTLSKLSKLWSCDPCPLDFSIGLRCVQQSCNHLQECTNLPHVQLSFLVQLCSSTALQVIIQTILALWVVLRHFAWLSQAMQVLMMRLAERSHGELHAPWMILKTSVRYYPLWRGVANHIARTDFTIQNLFESFEHFHIAYQKITRQ